MLSAKKSDSNIVAFIEIICVVLCALLLAFNSRKTVKLDQQYDELNITASDYTIFVNVTAAHRFEFNERFGNKLA